MQNDYEIESKSEEYDDEFIEENENEEQELSDQGEEEDHEKQQTITFQFEKLEDQDYYLRYLNKRI